MTSTTTKPNAVQPDAETAVYLFEDWFDPIEAGLRDRAAISSRRCSRPSSTRLSPTRAMHGGPRRVKGVMAALPAIGTAAEHGR